MKTLKKFECAKAKIIVRMHNIVKEKVPALYSVQEMPKSKNAHWLETIKYFDFGDEAHYYFLSLVTFWCK